MSDLSVAPRQERIELGMREKRHDLPNFRDHGMTVDAAMLRLFRNLQRGFRYGWVSERTLRAMIHEDTGHLPGVDTLRKAQRRLELEGRCEVRWIVRGTLMPNGEEASVGCLRVRVPKPGDFAERRRIAKRAPFVDHKREFGGMVRLMDLPDIERELVGAAKPAPAPAPDDELAFHRRRQEQLRLAAEWVAIHGNDGKGPAPPS